jgi:hypothetical protein
VARTTVHQSLIEGAVRDTLKAWLPSQLRRVAVENGLQPRGLPEPRSWPIASEFDLKPQERLPALFIVAGGKTGPAQRGPKGWRATWGCEVAIAVAAESEAKARDIAGMELAAIRLALLWHPTLDGLCEHIEWGIEDLAIGSVGRSHRAVYGAQFDLVIPQAIARRPPEEPPEPPSDPYDPPEIPAPLETAEITVTSERLDQ